MNLVEITESGDIAALQDAMRDHAHFSEAEIIEALVRAITHEYLDAVKLLLPHINNIDAPLILGRNALILAAEIDNIEIIRYLLNQGADVNARDSFGDTPLHVAIDAEIEAAIEQSEYSLAKVRLSTDVVELLIARGADINARTVQGQTPLDWANRGHPGAQALLKAQGAV